MHQYVKAAAVDGKRSQLRALKKELNGIKPSLIFIIALVLLLLSHVKSPSMKNL